MKIAISGTRGLLGSKLKHDLSNKKGFDILDVNRPHHDITDIPSMVKLFSDNKIDIFINCAAYTDVPKAEEESDLAYAINAEAPATLANLCAQHNTHLIHFSTDFVFNGKKNEPYLEGEKTNPLNQYGYSKLLGEINIKAGMASHNKNCYSIFRLQWLFGDNNKNFFQKILNYAKTGNTVKLVDDEFGSPCSAAFISHVIQKVITEKGLDNFKGEIYHLSHDNFCSRYDCGKHFLNALGYTNVERISDLPAGKVQRPKNGTLDVSKLNNSLYGTLGTWEHDLDAYIQHFKKSEQINVA